MTETRCTIRTAHGRYTADIRTHDHGPFEGQLDEEHLTEIVRHLAREAGGTAPLGVTVEGDGADWTWTLIDAATWDALGTVKIHAGAGA